MELSKLRTVNWGTGSLKKLDKGSFDPGVFSSTQNWWFFASDFCFKYLGLAVLWFSFFSKYPELVVLRFCIFSKYPRTGSSLTLIFVSNAQNWWCLNFFKEQLLPHWDVPFIFCPGHKQAKTDLFKKATDHVHGKQIIS